MVDMAAGFGGQRASRGLGWTGLWLVLGACLLAWSGCGGSDSSGPGRPIEPKDASVGDESNTPDMSTDALAETKKDAPVGAESAPDAPSDVAQDPVSETSCSSKTCAQMGFNCGTALDDCGAAMDCGTCPSGQSCGGGGTNKCGNNPCAAKTCAQLGASCGMTTDQCSSVLDCGACPLPETCGGGGTPHQCGCSCTLPHASTWCASGACKMTGCDAGWADCNGNSDDGCEASTDLDPSHCGGCGVVCSYANGTPNCTAGKCVLGGCQAGNADCDGNPENGCETHLASDIQHCGACPNACPITGGTPECKAGTCGYSTCAAGSGDCDGNPANGCETNTTTSVLNCGACASPCAPLHATAACTAGVCHVAACAAGYGNCDSNDSNGCETATSLSVQHCGTCGNACPTPPNMTANCSSGTCSSTCTGLSGNCDGQQANGCEADLLTDPSHCGSCTTVCQFAHAAANCQGGGCAMGACAAGFGDCNGLSTDGCETSLITNPLHCGSCTTACPASPPHATAACLASSCVLTCLSNYGDCDGNPANGCETLLDVSSSHCGACGHSCLGGLCLQGECPYKDIGDNVENPGGIAVDATRVYVATDRDGISVLKTGGSTVIIEHFGIHPRVKDVAIDATNSFWTTNNDNVVAKDTLSSGTPAKIISPSEQAAYGIALDSTHVFWTTENGNTVRRATKDGTNITTIATNQGRPHGIAVDDLYVYWVANNNGNVMRADKITFALTVLASAQLSPEEIASDGAWVYWTNRNDDKIMKINRDGTGMVALAANQNSAFAIALDSTQVYFGTQNGVVGRVSKNGGPVLVLATGQSQVTGIAVDDTHVYWASDGIGAVRRTPK